MADENEDTLSEIMSNTAPTPETTTTSTEQQPEAPAPTEGAVRDEHGRFAPKAPPAEPEATEQPPVATTEPAQAGTVPQQALHEARQKLKEEQDARSALERRLAALEQAGRQPVIPPKPAEPVPLPMPWDDGYTDSITKPLTKQMEIQKLSVSRLIAESKFGDEVVKAADDALGEFAKINRQAAEQVANRMRDSRHPYAELVAWHKEEQNRQRIGGDPDAFVKSELDKMLSDPAKRAELLAQLTGVPASPDPAGSVQAPAPVTNVTRLPPSLSKLPGGNAAPVDGDDSLGAIIASGRRRG